MPLVSFQHKAKTRRGDTIIEVMFAIVIFCFVAVLSISMMDLGLANGESALELVTARNELNAQAEALRFIHSSYISEKTLPTCTPQMISAGEKCQQYDQLWQTIVSNAIPPEQAQSSGLTNLAEAVSVSPDPNLGNARGCAKVYQTGSNGRNLLSANNAFILNTRNLSSRNNSNRIDISQSYISAVNQSSKFRETPLNARLIFSSSSTFATDSTDELTDQTIIYNQLASAEGIWAIAVKNDKTAPTYYDFYIETCWYAPNSLTPTAIDTVIRLYNPENVN